MATTITRFRENDNGIFTFDHVDSVGVSGETFNLPFTADMVTITNQSDVSITAAGNTILPWQSKQIVSRMSSIIISASNGFASFKIEGQKNADDPQQVSIVGSLTKLSTDPFPTDGIQNGWTMLNVDTKDAFVFHSGSWWPL